MDDDPVVNMRGRVQQCRRLAGSVDDRATTLMLLKMAQDIEADIQRIEAERAKRDA